MNSCKFLKWAIILSLFLFGLFCFLKDRGYCDEYNQEYIDYGKEFNYEFPNPPIPVEDEYLYQYPCCKIDIKSKLYNSKWVNPYDHVWKDDPYNKKPSQAQRQEWQDLYDQHHYDAVRTYNDAYNRIWWLPNLTMRQIGRDAWVAAASACGTKSPSQALVVAFTSMLTQYGLHCLDEWDIIQDKLYWSKYHFEQCVYYSNLLRN